MHPTHSLKNPCCRGGAASSPRMQSEKHLQLRRHRAHRWGSGSDGKGHALVFPKSSPKIEMHYFVYFCEWGDNRPSRKDSWNRHGPHRQYYCREECSRSAYLPVYARKIDASEVKMNDMDQITHPRMNPTIDMTAAVRPYVNRLASHAVGSGNVSINQSWKIGGNLQTR